MKNIILWAITILVTMNSVFAGVVFPIPDLQLKPGESGRFQYVIQTGTLPMKCSMSLDHKTNLIVEFDETETILDSPSKPLYGSVTVPENLGAGDYKETFCVSCESISETSGSSIRPSFCDIPIKVEIVLDRTKSNMQFPNKPKTGIDELTILGIIVLIVLIVALILLGLKRSKNRKKN
ncbi:LPXTG cell wall anchor domain-containing protein [Candidatus Woesearchaeota archaeon]|nr:LPXTG cell wall anchor domain-containing protein [Candidatus Woesearchaeota archaeon]